MNELMSEWIFREFSERLLGSFKKMVLILWNLDVRGVYIDRGLNIFHNDRFQQ